VKCPHCKAKKATIQPPAGTHCYTIYYECGYRAIHVSDEKDSVDIESKCPHQTYDGYLTIKQFAEANNIEMPKPTGLALSDLYVDIAKNCKDRITHHWISTNTDKSECKHMMHHYNINDLKSYFNV
jgi:hypothetical protein